MSYGGYMKVTWLFEPFHIKGGLVKNIFNSIKPLTNKKNDLQVLNLTTGTEVELLTAYDVAIDERFTLYPKSLIQQIFKKNNIAIDSESINVINKNTFSTSTAVSEVVKLAKKNKTDLLALMTKNKSTMHQLFIGSFAEQLLLQSPIDLFVFNPSNKVDYKIKKIFYACDMTGSYLKDLKKVILYAKHFQAELIVFHQSRYFSNAALFEQTAQVNQVKNNELAEKISKELSAAKIRGQVVIGTKLRSTYDYILTECKKHKADLIITRTKESKIGSFFGGSVVRQIVRLSKKPVLILRG